MLVNAYPLPNPWEPQFHNWLLGCGRPGAPRHPPPHSARKKSEGLTPREKQRPRPTGKGKTSVKGMGDFKMLVGRLWAGVRGGRSTGKVWFIC